jgi:hypothetical protein
MRPPKFAFLLVLCACTAADAPSGPAKDRVDPDATPEDSGALDTSAPQGWQDDADLYTNCWSDIDPLRSSLCRFGPPRDRGGRTGGVFGRLDHRGDPTQ